MSPLELSELRQEGLQEYCDNKFHAELMDFAYLEFVTQLRVLVKKYIACLNNGTTFSFPIITKKDCHKNFSDIILSSSLFYEIASKKNILYKPNKQLKFSRLMATYFLEKNWNVIIKKAIYAKNY
ncbi:MAG: hypothetical protein D8M58_16355 [Calditrichaeota bacterium]|nr:MAG: hypothetical protein DWQ03_08085 [Calditrichota bacterium]MBL1206979.1 hypothetical protein [Calditrichota bacterium]NOG46806.1 hypothetical protein [Calditrichota bacterium]